MSAARQITEWNRSPADVVKLDLPMPPSMNALWRKGRSGMYRSPSYMTWLNAAGTLLNAQHPGRIEGDYVLLAKFQRKDNRRRDIDNYLKGLSDLLEQHGVIENDCMAQSITALWSPAVEGCHVVLTRVQQPNRMSREEIALELTRLGQEQDPIASRKAREA